MLPESLHVTMKVVEAFRQLSIPYLIGGSLASAVHGVSRSTMDADLVADIKLEQIAKLDELLREEFYIDPDTILKAVQQKESFNLIHLETIFKIDVFILENRPFDVNRMQRRLLQPLGDPPSAQAYFSTAEDIILAKLEWFRMGGEVSDRQWRDILGILDIQSGRLDIEYLQKWASSLQVDDLLNRAMEETER